MPDSNGTGRGRALSAGATGTVIYPDDPEWDRARSPWVVNLDQRPTAVAVVRSVEDVSAAITSAARSGLMITAQGTGHGASALASLDATVLLRTGALNQVTVNDGERSVTVGSGATWGAVAAAAAAHGHAVQAGSSPDVGAAGFLLSGGISWLARSRGLAVNDIARLEVITADGERRLVDHDHDQDLFWALRGGGGTFGIVTSITLRMHAQPTVAAGTLFFPIGRAGEVLHAWRRWTHDLPEHTMSCGRLIQLPDQPAVPAPLRGQAFVSVEVAHQGRLPELTSLIRPLRELQPAIDTISEMPTDGLGALHMDPPGPTPCRGNGMLLDAVPSPAIDTLVGCAGQESGSPLLSVELRHLGGALARRPSDAGALGHFDADFALYAVGVTRDQATTRKVDNHIQHVTRALAPWAADLHYANFDETPTQGRTRFHDPGTITRLQSIQRRIDPAGTFTGSHPITST